MKSRIVRVGLLGLLSAAVAAGALATSGQGQSKAKTSAGGRYVLEVDGLKVGAFTKLAGIHSAVDQVEYAQSGSKGTEYGRFVGKAKPPTITLRRPVSANLSLHGWHDAVRGGNMPVAVRSGTLTAFDDDGKIVGRWRLENAMPVELDVVPMAAGGSDVLVEVVTLAADAVQALGPK